MREKTEKCIVTFRTTTGAMAMDTSLKISTNTPPRPHITMGPNWGSLFTPMITSVPA